MPQFSYEQVINVERKPEHCAVDHDQLVLETDLAQEELDNFFGTQIEDYRGDRNKIAAKMNEAAVDEVVYLQEGSPTELTQLEKDIPEACWKMGEIFNKVFKRRELDKAFAKAKDNHDSVEMDKISLEVDHLNIYSAEWQNQLVKMMFILEQTEEGKSFLQFYWEKFDELGQEILGNDPEEFKAIKNGALGLKASMEIFESQGWEAYMAFPEQDAIQKIDLWVKKGNNMLAVQIKSRASMMYLSGTKVDRYENPNGYSRDEAKEIRQRNLLLTSAREYDKLWRLKNPDLQVRAYWMLVSTSEVMYDQDPNTGKLFLPPDFTASKFAVELAALEGGPNGQAV